MKKILVIPDSGNLGESCELARKYGLGFEYNDFFDPEVLDSESRINDIIAKYGQHSLPQYCTLHGAFFDVSVFSVDRRIREISALRVEQSIAAAKKIGAKAVVFHTNYNPFLNTRQYVESWIRLNAEYWGGVLARNPDIRIYLENMFDNSPEIMAELASELDKYPNFGICFDYAHAALTPVPHKEWARALGKYVRHMHINDNDLVGDLHLAVGDGKIDWSEFRALYEEHFVGASVLIETSSLENQRRSIERLTVLGFMG